MTTETAYIVTRRTVQAPDNMERSYEETLYDNEMDAVEGFRGYTAHETFADEWRNGIGHERLKRTRYIVELWEGEELINVDDCDYQDYLEWEAAGFPNFE